MKQRWEFDFIRAIDELEIELNLKNTVPHWDSMARASYTPSNFKDIEIYLEHYNKLSDESKKFILIEIIMDAVAEQPNEIEFWKYWKKVKPILTREYSIHEYTVNYWKDMTAANFENCKFLSQELNKLIQEM